MSHPQRAATMRLFKALDAAGFYPVNVDTGGLESHRVTSWAEAAGLTTAVDMAHVRLSHPARNTTSLLWVFLVYGNDDFELCADYTDWPILDLAVQEFAEAEEKRGS